jgi:glycine oxidase
VNITVAGAGVVGCAIAHELASRGAQVLVLDARGPGGGASRASAGILAPYIEGHDRRLLSLCVRSLRLWDDFTRRVTAAAEQPVEYERHGTLQVARNADEAARLNELALSLRQSDVAHELISAKDAARFEPAITPETVAALHIPEHGYVSADELTGLLAAAASSHGATFDVEPVVSVHGGGVPRVQTARRVIESDAVIIAAGSWSASLDAAHAAPHAVRPIRGQLLQLRLTQRPAERVIWGSDCYLVPRRDGTVLAGATVEDVGFDERATVAGVGYLVERAVRLMPALRDAVFEGVRVGLRPMTSDELPVVGASSTMPGVFYATGHFRNGVLLAPLTARLVADLVLGQKVDEDLALLLPERLGL